MVFTSQWNSKTAALAVFIGSVSVTLLFLSLLPASLSSNQSSDYRDFYKPTAVSIYEGKGIVDSKGNPATTYPPGFPLIIAGTLAVSKLSTIPHDTCILLFNILGLALSSTLLFYIANLYWGPILSLIPALAWMTYPFVLWLTKQPSSEISFFVLLYAGCFLFCQALIKNDYSLIPYFTSGFTIGLSTLIRPISIGLVLVIGVSFLIIARSVSKVTRFLVVVALLSGNAAAILPWELWMYQNTGKVVALSGHGTSSIRDGLTFTVDNRGFRNHENLPNDVISLMREFVERSDEMTSLPSIVSVFIEETVNHPWPAAKLLFLKFTRSWYATDSGKFETISLLTQLPYVLMILWCTLKCWTAQRPQRHLCIIVWLMMFYFWGMTILVLSIVRYMIAAVGLLLLLLPVVVSGSTPPFKTLRSYTPP